MDLVVVLLKSVQKKIIVPEYYINGYNQSFLKLLKNKGNNAGRDHLIYWSNDVVEGEFYPDPDQNAEELTHFPPQKDGWYRGRTLWFTDDFEEAKKVRDRKRNVVPPVYNEARLAEQPLPVLVLCPDASESETDENDDDPLAIQNDDDPSENLSNDNNDDSTISSEFGVLNVSSNNENETAVNNNNNNTTTNRLDGTVDGNLITTIESTKLSVAPNNTSLALIDSSTANNQNYSVENASTSTIPTEPNAASNSSVVCGGTNQDAMSSNSMFNVQVKKEPQFEPIDEEDANVIANIFDGSFEKLNDSDDDILIGRDAFIPPPIKDKTVDDDKLPYKVKKDDVISANIPFALNEKGDRSYIAVKGRSFKEVCLPKGIVAGLSQYNSSGFRENPKYHLRFIKALLIGLIGQKKLVMKESDDLVMEFIHDLYNIRLGKPVEIKEFEKMIADATKEIINANFY